ncbi:S41 family peptidase [Aquimarina sediminis]|uniref:S41 family peptidase n=1 Tax=Aquimarina sediminis TaxID=2070536 RepID=UPI000CA07E48|nr:S41 family peptidase [Aquimarina sediminis]
MDKIYIIRVTLFFFLLTTHISYAWEAECVKHLNFYKTPYFQKKIYDTNPYKLIKDSTLIKFRSKIENKKLIQDFNQLLETLKEHPSQFEFIDKLSFENLINTQRDKLKDSMTVTEFYRVVSPIVASLGCLHTRIVDGRFFRTPPKYWLPLIVWFKDQKMYAINNCVESTEMNIGSEILEINGISSREIYKSLTSSISADALNSKFYRGDLNVNFLYYYHSYYGFDSEYRIKFKPYNSEKKITTTFFVNKPAPDYKVEINNKPRLNLEVIKEKEIAVIRIKNFNYYPRGKQNIDFFKKKLDDYILKMEQDSIKKIAFDLRGNRGGNPECTQYILSYITSKKINFYENNELNKRRNRPTVVEPKTNNISKKKIYFMIDGRCASATTQMLAVVKHNKLATLLGEETGGTYSTHPGRRAPVLKNTGLGLQIGTKRESVSVPRLPLNLGIVPNRPIELKVEHLMKQNDPILEYIINERGK